MFTEILRVFTHCNLVIYLFVLCSIYILLLFFVYLFIISSFVFCLFVFAFILFLFTCHDYVYRFFLSGSEVLLFGSRAVQADDW